MRVLVADDDPVLQAIVAAVLAPEGHEVLPALDGLQALELFLSQSPDLVLTDFDMPGLDGLELCRRIQGLPADRYVPIVVFTGAAQAGLLSDCLEAGATEFLTKPFQPDELRCRVKAIAERAELHNAMVLQKAMADEELAVVKHVLTRLTEKGLASLPPSFHMETLPTRRISGDACAFVQGLPGVHFGMLCDATGHGLMAGVSTIPVVEAFLSMSKRDIPLEHVFLEINRKLIRMLPTGRFACLLLFRMDLHQRVLSVLNAGFPEALLRRGDGRVRSFGSRNLPAGVASVAASGLGIEQVQIEPGDRFFAYSDGLQELFSIEEIQAMLLGELPQAEPEAHRATVRELIRSRVSDLEQHDDISWAHWVVPEGTGLQADRPLVVAPLEALRPGLKVETTLRPPFQGLKDLVPNLLLILGQQEVDQSTAQLLALLLTEALANAVDHGVLGLSSQLKLDGGFEAFEALREQRILAGPEGWVRVELACLEGVQSGRVRALEVVVEDSGPGFDWQGWLLAEEPEQPRPYGRGLTLIQALALKVDFNEKGNCITFRLQIAEA